MIIGFYLKLYSFPSSSTGSAEARGNEQAAKDDDFDLFGSDSEEEVCSLTE